MITVYTKRNCPYCVKAKALLFQKNETYTEIVIGEDILAEAFLQLYPEVRSAPFIIIDGEKVGGYDRLVEFYANGGTKQFLTEGNRA